MLRSLRGLWPYVRQQIRAELTLLITRHCLCKSRADVQAAGRECRLTVLEADLISKNIHRLMKMFKKGIFVHWKIVRRKKNAYNCSGKAKSIVILLSRKPNLFWGIFKIRFIAAIV